jgi:hypothetical protein
MKNLNQLLIASLLTVSLLPSALLADVNVVNEWRMDED